MKYFCILACILASLDGNYGCLPNPDKVSPGAFVFKAQPSMNATLGEALEIRCSVHGTNNTSSLKSIQVFSRTSGQLNTTCTTVHDQRECLFKIRKVELWHGGLYDCIRFYDGHKCFTKTMRLSVAKRRIPTVTTPTVFNVTRKVTSFSKTMRLPVTKRRGPTVTAPPAVFKVTHKIGIMEDTSSTTPRSGFTRRATYFPMTVFISILIMLLG